MLRRFRRIKKELFLHFFILSVKLRDSFSSTPRLKTLEENGISVDPKVMEEAVDLQSATEDGVPIIMT